MSPKALRNHSTQGEPPGPVLAKCHLLSRTPNNCPKGLRVAHCCKENETSTAFIRPVQFRVPYGSGGCPGAASVLHSRVARQQSSEDWQTFQGFCGNGYDRDIVRSSDKYTHICTQHADSHTLTITHSLCRSSCCLSLKASRCRMEHVLSMPHAHLRHPDWGWLHSAGSFATGLVTETPLVKKINMLFASLK